MIDINRQLIRSFGRIIGITFIKIYTYIFLDSFLCNFMRPKTSDNDFSKKKKTKSIMLIMYGMNIKLGIIRNYISFFKKLHIFLSELFKMNVKIVF